MTHARVCVCVCERGGGDSVGGEAVETLLLVLFYVMDAI